MANGPSPTTFGRLDKAQSGILSGGALISKPTRRDTTGYLAASAFLFALTQDVHCS